jgi:peptide/nickel transport system substrate-binding protein
MTRGAAPTADSYMPPIERRRPLVESAIPQYPYDPSRAVQLLAEAGWVRGADGALVRQPGGERFEIDVWGRPGSASENELSLIADNWKAIGAQPTSYMIPVQRVTDRQLLATYSGVLLHNPPWEGIYENRFHTRDFAAESNRWSGRNAAGYSNPRVDGLVDALLVAIEPERQVALHRDLLNAVMTDVAFMPLYWVIQPALVRGRVKGDVTAFKAGWNIFDWDLES